MKPLKATLTAALLAAAALGLADMSLDAVDHQYEHAPRPPLSHILDMCKHGDQTACDIHDDMINTGEKE